MALFCDNLCWRKIFLILLTFFMGFSRLTKEKEFEVLFNVVLSKVRSSWISQEIRISQKKIYVVGESVTILSYILANQL